MRRGCVRVHRYAGLGMAFFLIVAGLTGSVLAFHDEIERWINPDLFIVTVPAIAPIDPLTLRERAEALFPEAYVDSVRFDRQPDEAFISRLAVRTDPATGEAYALRHDEIFLDPYTGRILGSRHRGALSLAHENLMPFLYRVHRQLALPGKIGTWILGTVALAWTLDCFVGFFLTLPVGSRHRSMLGTGRMQPDEVFRSDGIRKSFWSCWKPAWQLKLGAGSHRVNYDLHRAAGLWLWVMLFVIAWSAVAFQLREQVYTPVMSLFFDMGDVQAVPERKTPLDAPRLSWREAYAFGQRIMAEQSLRHGFTVEHETGLRYDRRSDVYHYTVKSSRDIGRDSRTRIAFDADTGVLMHLNLPTGRYAGTTITHWLMSLHMAKVFGPPMQIFTCLMGVVVTMLSVTGIAIWNRKRRVRRRDRSHEATPRSRGRSPIHCTEVPEPDP